ncbi:MAG: hypothetical protein CM1200mP10_32280 [Candidatus Neomarinimicrobiota bacterium]|nr:MAG: hypothetical protein CM1200mP10_32280 [Candidatus Neomarinimicrobiota bacterium]
MFVNTLDPDLKVFFSREVSGEAGEDLVEKQNAESGGMPVVRMKLKLWVYSRKPSYGRIVFSGKRPKENFSDGVNVTELLMTAYMSANRVKPLLFHTLILILLYRR